MTDHLPMEAERYLETLSHALRAMPRNEREAVLLELRDHLTARAAQGDAVLASSLDMLGPAHEFAQEYLSNLPPARRSLRDLMLRPFTRLTAGVTAGLPTRTFTAKAAIGETLATLRGSGDGLRILGAVLLVAVSVTNILVLLGAASPGSMPPKEAAMLLRVSALLFAFVAGYRIFLADTVAPWRLDRPFMRYFGASVVMLACLLGCALLLRQIGWGIALGLGFDPANSYGARIAMRILIGIIAVIGFTLALLRFQPWMIGLAIGRKGLTPAGSWRGMRGKTRAVIGAWLVLILPLFLLHYGLIASAGETPHIGLKLLLSSIDGIVAMAQALLTLALLATAYRWVMGMPAPEPRAFAAAAPDRKAIDAARQPLLDAIEARYERQMRPMA